MEIVHLLCGFCSLQTEIVRSTCGFHIESALRWCIDRVTSVPFFSVKLLLSGLLVFQDGGVGVGSQGRYHQHHQIL